ncbi:MAG TPA: hypothetical protein VK157_12165 [Phycisphaerales bacterium]|nr:hypothetical protein [Phycisphaerales bacterium]
MFIAATLSLLLGVTAIAALAISGLQHHYAVEWGRSLYSSGAINAAEYNTMLRDNGSPRLIEGPAGDANLDRASVEDGEAIAWPFINRFAFQNKAWAGVLLISVALHMALLRSLFILRRIDRTIPPANPSPTLSTSPNSAGASAP